PGRDGSPGQGRPSCDRRANGLNVWRPVRADKQPDRPAVETESVLSLQSLFRCDKCHFVRVDTVGCKMSPFGQQTEHFARLLPITFRTEEDRARRAHGTTFKSLEAPQ